MILLLRYIGILHRFRYLGLQKKGGLEPGFHIFGRESEDAPLLPWSKRGCHFRMRLPDPILGALAPHRISDAMLLPKVST